MLVMTETRDRCHAEVNTFCQQIFPLYSSHRKRNINQNTLTESIFVIWHELPTTTTVYNYRRLRISRGLNEGVKEVAKEMKMEINSDERRKTQNEVILESTSEQLWSNMLWWKLLIILLLTSLKI